jgi:transcriptional regulator with XRE-family HTH domain
MSMNFDAHHSLTSRVAAEVRAEMARQKRSGAELGRQLGLSYTTVSKRINGEVPFDIEELEATAAWLGATPVDLLTRAEAAA